MDLAAVAGGHMVFACAFFRDFIQGFGFDLIGILALIVLEVPGSDATPGIRCAPDKRGSKSPHGLVYLGTRNLVDKALVEFKCLHGMGDLDVHRATGRNGLEVLRAHDAAAAAPSSGILDPCHDVGIGHQVFTGRSDNHAFYFLIT